MLLALAVSSPAVETTGGSSGEPAADTARKEAPVAGVADRYRKIPIAFGSRGQLTLTGSADGRPINCVIDSGADKILLHTGVAKDLKLDLTRLQGEAKGASGDSAGVFTGTIKDLNLPGGIAVKNQRQYFVDLSPFSGIKVGDKPFPVECLLGMGFLNGTRVVVDYAAGEVLLPVTKGEPGAIINELRSKGASVVQMLRSPAGKWFVPLDVDGVKVALQLDTGADLVTLYPSVAEGKPWQRKTDPVKTVQTFGGLHKLETATVPTSTLGTLKIRDFSFALIGGEGRELPDEVSGVKVAGLLGANLLRPYNAVIDFETGCIAFPVRDSGGAKP